MTEVAEYAAVILKRIEAMIFHHSWFGSSRINLALANH